MGLSIGLDVARAACVESIDAFVDAVGSLGEDELLDLSRCHGWSRLDVVVHVIAGWQEMLGGMVSPVDSAPSVDAASYWPAFASEYATDDPVPLLMSQRRRTAAYARPASATDHLRDIAAMVRRGVVAYQDRSRQWQGHVFTAGDFLAIWVVEDVVHQLDLLSDVPAPASALGLARATIEALAGSRCPPRGRTREPCSSARGGRRCRTTPARSRAGCPCWAERTADDVRRDGRGPARAADGRRSAVRLARVVVCLASC